MTLLPRDRVATTPSGKRINLVRVAECQRSLLKLIAGVICCYFVFLLGARVLPPAVLNTAYATTGVLYAVLGIWAIVLTVQLSITLGRNTAWAVVCGLCMFIPLLGLLLLASANSNASRILTQHGVKVGLMGVSPEQMHKLRHGVCVACGYDIRSITTGLCPECGTKLTPHASPAG